jgi:hypothetical protein
VRAKQRGEIAGRKDMPGSDIAVQRGVEPVSALYCGAQTPDRLWHQHHVDSRRSAALELYDAYVAKVDLRQAD